MASIVVLTGGGIKGAVAAGRYAREHELLLLHVAYGQPSAANEVEAVRDLARSFPHAQALALDLPIAAQLDLPGRVFGKMVKTEPTQKADPASGPSPAVLRGLMPVIFAVGLQTALRVGSSMLVTGFSRRCDAMHLGLASAGTSGDQIREFLHSFGIMADAFRTPKTSLRVESPLVDLTYANIVKLAERFGVPQERTWSCVDTARRPCGRCEQCAERCRAFHEAGVADPRMAVARA